MTGPSLERINNRVPAWGPSFDILFSLLRHDRHLRDDKKNVSNSGSNGDESQLTRSKHHLRNVRYPQYVMLRRRLKYWLLGAALEGIALDVPNIKLVL